MTEMKERKVGNMEKKSRMIHEYMETICTDRKKITQPVERLGHTQPCLVKRIEKKYVRGSQRAVARSGKHMASFCPHQQQLVQCLYKDVGIGRITDESLILIDLPCQQCLWHTFCTLDSRAQYVHFVGPKGHLTVEDLKCLRMYNIVLVYIR